MNTGKLKIYAPKARLEFIQAVTDRAHYYGLSKDRQEPVNMEGDFAIIAGRAFPKAVADQRNVLEERIAASSFDHAMEVIAYTWFNRFVAIRYMELHGYLDHGYRVLSHPEGQGRPEILDHAADVDLPGLDPDKVVELKLDGTQDEELYRLLLLAQCNALHQAMPFLFEPIGGADELLLPTNLLHTDSLIRQLVEGIDESAWDNIEIIGWLYQFYISEKKDQVIGKVVKSEDIPAATQLFTPNWIVKYMVQNSLGAQWLATYPHSPLKGQMEYYIEPAEQAPEVQQQLTDITPTSLNPEELTLIDPASGSGHILVEAYELFKAIYLERGYRQRDVPQLILEKNLFGLDIDERAAQLTGFALMMKGRADDRRLFERGVKLNVMALVDSAGFDAEGLAKGLELSDYALQPGDLTELKRLFKHATTFGSLIQVPERLAEKLPALEQLSDATSEDLFVSEARERLGPLVQQAELLAAQYDAVVVNPPYMGGGGMNSLVKTFAKDDYPGAKNDLFACFIDHCMTLAKDSGRVGVVAPYVWMFITSYEKLRRKILDETSLTSLIQLEYNAFEPACIPVATFTFMRHHVRKVVGSYIKLSDFKGHQNQAPRTLEAINNPRCEWFYRSKPDEFKKIPGSPVAYWASDRVLGIFNDTKTLQEYAMPRIGLQTSDKNRFVRLWSEISYSDIGLNIRDSDEAIHSGRKWFPYHKGGSFRKWYGNISYVVNWQDDGREIRDFNRYLNSSRASNIGIANTQFYFRESITWSSISSSLFGVRYSPPGFIFDNSASSVFAEPEMMHYLTSFLCSKLADVFLDILNPTLNYPPGTIGSIPLLLNTAPKSKNKCAGYACKIIDLSNDDWDAYERSWDFQSLPLVTASTDPTPTLDSSYAAWTRKNRDTIAEMKRLEEENNRLFIDAYGLADELTPDVPIEQITLTVNPAYRYGGKLTEEEQWTRFRQDTMEELVSYAIGCMMGRYSLDAPGLIYAHSGNEGFNPSRYITFPADDDGIIPITDRYWFDDDVTERYFRFVETVWPKETLEENLDFTADSIGRKSNETSREAIRRFFVTDFFKNHLKRYKKRPIYWLFSSGKEKALQCLVYLHRYNEGTLSRMRIEYLIPLQGRIASKIESLQKDMEHASSTSAANKTRKEIIKLEKQVEELRKYDEKLRHYADMKIKLDLDDGVKVNYSKFGDLLAEVKLVAGTK
ncbi:BREX-1 system adenine-specific DNA-methyltransferase PglX [Planctomycetota bacterium]